MRTPNGIANLSAADLASKRFEWLIYVFGVQLSSATNSNDQTVRHWKWEIQYGGLQTGKARKQRDSNSYTYVCGIQIYPVRLDKWQ